MILIKQIRLRKNHCYQSIYRALFSGVSSLGSKLILVETYWMAIFIDFKSSRNSRILEITPKQS